MLRDKKDIKIAALESDNRKKAKLIKSLERRNKQLDRKTKHLENIIDASFERLDSKIK